MIKYSTLRPLIFSCILSVILGAEIVPDLVAAASVASDYKVQSIASGAGGKYGYPYLVAPTLGPAIQARSDDDDEKGTIRVAKPYGSRIASTTDGLVKKGNPKKSKILFTQEAARRQDGEEEKDEKRFRSYYEPKYRNFEELEAEFSPRRRIDLDSPYSQYEYKLHRKPSVSSRDPYLSPSSGPIDGFYPVPKIKNSYSSYGSRGYSDGPLYGAGKYDDSVEYHGGSYGGPSSSYPLSGDPDVSYNSGEHSPSGPSGGSYGYDNFAIKSNEPIIGDIRKKLLDYAGASDLYDGEPDYLREVGRKKYKYGSVGNDYYSYGGQGYRDSYKEFPYVESKISLIKKSRGL